MTDDGGMVTPLSSSLLAPFRHLWRRPIGLRFGGPELGVRFALVVFGLAAMAAARSLAFTVGAVPDRELPPIPPLRWLFHVADGLFLPGLSHLNLNQTQQVQFLAIVVAIFLFYLAVRSSVPAILRRCYRPLAYVAVALATLLSVLSLQGILPFPLALGTQHYGNDAITVTSCATDDFVHWRNPYDSFNMPQCLSRHDQDGSKTTPLMAGSFKSLMPYPSRATLDAAFSAVVRQGIKHPPQFESYFSYPAASFLLPALFAPFHLSDLSLVYLLVYVALASGKRPQGRRAGCRCWRCAPTQRYGPSCSRALPMHPTPCSCSWPGSGVTNVGFQRWPSA